jgi:hypothetical protein
MFHQWGIILARTRVSGGAEHISQDAAGKRYISNSCQLFYLLPRNSSNTFYLQVQIAHNTQVASGFLF